LTVIGVKKSALHNMGWSQIWKYLL